MRSATLTVLLVLVAACVAPGRQFHARLEALGELPELRVIVQDHTGLVTSLAPEFGPNFAAVENLQGQPDVLVVAWVARRCEFETTLTFRHVKDAYEVAVTRLVAGPDCPPTDITRSMGIYLTEPVAADSVTLVGAN